MPKDNYGKKIGTMETIFSKWWHWNTRLLSLGFLFVGILYWICKETMIVLIMLIVITSLANYRMGKKSHWEFAKYIIYEEGILCPVGLKRTYDEKAVLEMKEYFFKIPKEKEFIKYEDIVNIEIKRKAFYVFDEMMIIKSGFKFYIPHPPFAEEKLLPYIKEKIDEAKNAYENTDKLKKSPPNKSSDE